MKFPRNTRIFRGQFDFAPFASVFFLLMIFLLHSSLIYTPGVRVPLQLPPAEGQVAGVDGPTISVAVDADGRFYYQNEAIREADLLSKLKIAVKTSGPVTLVVQADKAVRHETIVHLRLLATEAGIQEMFLAVLPGVFGEREHWPNGNARPKPPEGNGAR